jgi:predicted AAA+ superfamily ATPase
MVEAYAVARALPIDTKTLRAQAAEWATTRGARSGRVAFQFIEDLTGRLARA